jgi:hypothetical protein
MKFCFWHAFDKGLHLFLSPYAGFDCDLSIFESLEECTKKNAGTERWGLPVPASMENATGWDKPAYSADFQRLTWVS